MAKTVPRRKAAALPLLLTKLHPPTRREQTVTRDRLIERLRPDPGVKLTVVAAPVGSGKTTLLAAWREHEQEKRPVAWLSLDEGDNDPVVLWTYILAALRTAVPTLDVSASPEGVGADYLVHVLLPELSNELTVAGEVALVLDDFHRLTGGPARDSIAWFIDNAPSTFRLLIATRREPGLPLPTLRAHAELLELRAEDLAFTTSEAENLFNDRLGLGLKRPSVAGLVEQTEGWPAGLYLAALSLQAANDREAFATRFGGRSRHVIDFLMDEVLETYDPATQDLMIRSSILERLSGPLCDAVLEEQGSNALLQALARSNLFLIPLDDRGEWYRFHHLFAQLLRVELERREPGRDQTLHRRACTWFRAHGAIEEAVEHSLAAGAVVEARELIAGEWPRYATAGRSATVLTWLGRLPPEVLENDAQLLLAKAWVLSLDRQREEAVRAIAALESLESQGVGPLADGFSSPEASLAALRGYIGWGDTAAGLESARRAAELEEPKSPWRPLIALSVGIALYDNGDAEQADSWLAEVTEPLLAREQWRLAAPALAYRSIVAGELGRIEEQIALADHAARITREHGLEEIASAPPIALGLSLSARELFEDALSAFEHAERVARRTDHTLHLAFALICRAETLYAMNEQDAARAIVEEARAAVASCPAPGAYGRRLAALERRPRARRNGNSELSERELVILRMLTGPLSEGDIGRELYLSRNTVHSHTKSIYRKLGASSRAEAVERARELGVV
jgi:LuxR family maltose regulon positive regulatory protein